MEKLKQYEQYDEKLELEVSLCYGYLYLKEGDLLSLQKELMIAEKLFSQLPQCLDFVEYRLQIWMLRQAYCLKSFDFEGACIWENKLVDYMESLKDLLYITGIWTDEASVPNELQEEMTSLYLMRIYYNWRLTSGDTGKWAEQLQKASDQLEKSQMEFIRIFPRACYYYQIKEEHHTRALIWLFRFAGISINAEQVSDWSKLRKKAAVFCQVLIEMDGRQKIELIREYFILIVSLKKQEIREKLSYTPSFILYEAAHKSGLFDVLVKQKEGQPILKTVLPTQNLPRYKHLVRSVLKDFQDRIYHPEEQVWWLLASYLELCNGSSRTQIDRYYDRALKICGDSSEYAVMNLSALAIWTDKIGNAMIRNQEKTKQLWNKFQQVYRKTMKKGCLPEKMKEYVQLLFRRQGINPDWNESEAGSETGRQLMSIAERFLALASF